MQTWDQSVAYFPRESLACKCCDVMRIDMALAVHLPWLRAQWGRPLIVGVCCICPKRNDALQGHPQTLHLTHHSTHTFALDNEQAPIGALAITFRWAGMDYREQLELAQLAYTLGWSVGLHSQFIDIDRRTDIGIDQVVYYADDWHFDFRKEHVRGAALSKPKETAVLP